MTRKLADLINILFGFRKFILMMALFAVGIIFRLKGLLNGQEFVDLFKATTISFFGANGVEHLMTTVKSYMDSKGKPSTPSAPADDIVEPDEDDSAASAADAKASK
jgi:hypothetical protein